MNASGYRYKQNRFQQLRGFCYAAALGSVSKAARRMYLSQPAVSQQIQSLENELAVTLFVRRGSKMQLTHDGELLFEMARPLIEELEHLDEKFGQRRQEVDEGHIEIAAGLSTILYFLPGESQSCCLNTFVESVPVYSKQPCSLGMTSPQGSEMIVQAKSHTRHEYIHCIVVPKYHWHLRTNIQEAHIY